ncbi:CAZyme family AA3 [Penicillium paradoxum]|uniref:CAZyme family AA3 n=1 Tax=Penicillium paradoxum TaxID=176176 RepID=UPI00254775DD|nr:CAZyme family AA3 [Penicillium paradoxum]KAJ5788384.1 CAZyme family AA3 [Penicillium paradoxum]
MTVIVDLLRPLSEGEATLNSSDAQVQPNINLNFFGSDLDIVTMRKDPRGTARFSKSIHQGVVDSKLRVYGIRNLRIADASAIPATPDCRVQNTTYMIG